MSFDLREAMDEMAAVAPPPRRTIHDVLVEGKALHQRRQRTRIAGAVVGTVAALVAAVAVPHTMGTFGGKHAAVLQPGAGNSATTTFPTLDQPFMYSIKEYVVGALHVSDPVLATPVYQQSNIIWDRTAPSAKSDDAARLPLFKDRPDAMLTVFRPGVFVPKQYAGGRKVTVHGREGYLGERMIELPGSDQASGGERGASSTQPRSVPVLAWQYADNAWATIVWSQAGAPSDAATAVQALAAGLAPGPVRAVKLPMRFDAIAPGAILSGYHLIAVGRAHPFENRPNGAGDSISVAYISREPAPTSELTSAYQLEAIAEDMPLRAESIRVVVMELAVQKSRDVLDSLPGTTRTIDDRHAVNVIRGDAKVRNAVSSMLRFDNLGNQARWHDVTKFGLGA